MPSRPLLVLVHGTRFDARSWDCYGELVPGADLVAVDLPGHGARVGQPYSTDAAVPILEAAVAGVDDTTPVVMAGHSLGGYVAAAYAQRHPERLAALVLIGACADPARHRVLRGVYTGFARLLPVVGTRRMARVADATLRRLGMEESALPDASGYAVVPQAWGAVVAEAGPHQLSRVQCPVFLVGGQYDQLRIDADAYARACADARIRVVPRASHLAPMTHREQVAAVLREAVDEATSGA